MARYELVERIGVGGMAEIFRGKATAGGGFEKPVAIKRILPHLSQDVRFVELLITEAKTLSQLRHRNIVQIHDVGVGDDGQYFLVMEFVDGLDLGELYETLERRGKMLPLEVSLHICAEVCEALDHAHRATRGDGQSLGIVHRDVSPSNVLLSRSGEVKLTDFGIAKRAEEATGHGGVRGKFAYISPEQAANVHVDARSDVFSCGIVLYELVVGRRLFSQLPDFDALRAVQAGDIPRPREIRADLAPELEAILLTALAPNPANRFDSAAAFAAKLRGYRYSLDSTIADPAQELSRLVDRGNRAAAGISTEGTFVRISTAAGFIADLGPEDATLVARPGDAIRRAPARLPSNDRFDETQTKALSLAARQAMSMRSSAPRATPPIMAGMIEVVSTGNLEDEETRLHAPGPPGAARPPTPSPQLRDRADSATLRRPVAPPPPSAWPPPPRRPGSARPGSAPPPAAPSVLVADPESPTRLEPQPRKGIVRLAAVAIGFAVVAFAVTAAVLRGGNNAEQAAPSTAPKAAQPPGAGVPADASAQPALPRPVDGGAAANESEQPTTPKRTRKNRPRSKKDHTPTSRDRRR